MAILVSLLCCAVIAVVYFSYKLGQAQTVKKLKDQFDFESYYLGEKLLYNPKKEDEFFYNPPYPLTEYKCLFPVKVFPRADYIPFVISEVNKLERTYHVTVLDKTYEVTIINTSRGTLGQSLELEGVFFEPSEPLADYSRTFIKFVIDGDELKVVHVP
ncbi:MAG: hypothetical protein PHE89_01120 [Alphaproteobacteria bacterium]|nr:hypothetical protein [Alphaproteobacteria bacterium]